MLCLASLLSGQRIKSEQIDILGRPIANSEQWMLMGGVLVRNWLEARKGNAALSMSVF